MNNNTIPCYLITITGKIDTPDPYYLLVPVEDLTAAQNTFLLNSKKFMSWTAVVDSRLFGDRANNLVNKYFVPGFECLDTGLKDTIYSSKTMCELLQTRRIIDIFTFVVDEDDEW